MKRTLKAVVCMIVLAMCVPMAWAQEAAEPLAQYWTEGSGAAQTLRDFVARATDEGSEGFIPVADRIADFAQREGLYAHGQSVTARCTGKQ